MTVPLSRLLTARLRRLPRAGDPECRASLYLPTYPACVSRRAALSTSATLPQSFWSFYSQAGLANLPNWAEAGKATYFTDPVTLGLVMMILFNWAEVRRWRDIVNPGSVHEVRLSRVTTNFKSSNFCLPARLNLRSKAIELVSSRMSRTLSSRAWGTSALGQRWVILAASGSTRSTTLPPTRFATTPRHFTRYLGRHPRR